MNILKKMKIVMMATFLASLCLVCVSCDNETTSDVSSSVVTSSSGSGSSSTRTILDETFDLSAKYYKSVSFTLSKTASVSERVTVNSSSGTEGVRVFLLDENNYALFRNQYASLENAAAGFSYYASFSAPTRTPSYSTSGNLGSGTYYFVIYNPNLVYSQNITAKVTASE